MTMKGKDCLRIFYISVLVLIFFDLTPSVPGFDIPFYLLAGQHLFEGRLDCLRTPTYPIIIQSFKLLFGDEGLSIAMTVLQSLVYLLSVQSLVRLVGQVIRSRYIQLGTVFFYVLVIAPAWCNEIATESLSLSGCIILVGLVVRFYDSKKWNIGVILHILLLFLVFLRPTFVLFFAVLPCLWIWKMAETRQFCASMMVALVSTMICMGCFLLYNKSYEKQYGKQTSTISFECNTVYNLKRSGCWDVNVVSDPQAVKICKKLDEEYTCNYEPLYWIVDSIPGSLPLISEACDDMIQAHKQQYYRYRIQTFVESFNTRFPGAINTKSALSTLLFFWSLFWAMPLSLFYLVVPISVVALLYFIVKRKRVPVVESFIIVTTFAQYVGIVLSASEAHARLMIPVYGLFLLILAIGLDRSVRIVSRC